VPSIIRPVQYRRARLCLNGTTRQKPGVSTPGCWRTATSPSGTAEPTAGHCIWPIRSSRRDLIALGRPPECARPWAQQRGQASRLGLTGARRRADMAAAEDGRTPPSMFCRRRGDDLPRRCASTAGAHFNPGCRFLVRASSRRLLHRGEFIGPASWHLCALALNSGLPVPQQVPGGRAGHAFPRR
jgi:hypothetical protein